MGAKVENYQRVVELRAGAFRFTTSCQTVVGPLHPEDESTQI